MRQILQEYGDISPEIIHRYNRPGPRYTSYPTVPLWEQGDFPDDYRSFLKKQGQKPLSVYIHVPFCRRLCTFCGCNQFVTRDQELVRQYLDALETELDLVAKNLGERKVIKQLHFGGGTPTFLKIPQLRKVMAMIESRFDIDHSGEIALEANPRVTTAEQLETLYELGFRRISFGVQDLDSGVQRAINREQTLEQTQNTFYTSRKLGYDSVNIDLVYGLPRQTVATFRQTMEDVNRMRPDRLAIYSFAYIPNRFKTHRRAIKEKDLPVPKEKVSIYIESIRYLTSVGYKMIGMDHYAEPNDELAISQKNHTLHRNFMGYTTLKGLSQIGVGVSSISDFGTGYFQNEKDVHTYINKIRRKTFPVIRKKILTPDDVLRREVIETLMCHGHISVSDVEHKYNISFRDYFAKEQPLLEELEDEGFIILTPGVIKLTKLGVIFMRNVAMVFDSYLEGMKTFNFSKTV